MKNPSLIFLLLVAVLVSCVKPVKPVFRLSDGFLLVDGQLSNLPGRSSLSLSESVREGQQFVLNEISAQRVETVDQAGNVTPWIRDESRERYFPPVDYLPSPGNLYFVRITATDGSVYESVPETLQVVTELEDFRTSFVQESYFSNEINRFVPAFEIRASFTDDGASEDFYRFNYRSWEKLDVCVSCYFAQFNRATEMCVETQASRNIPRFDYGCLGDCWEVSRYADFTLLTDEFINGNRVSGLQLGQVDFDWYGPILIVGELQKISANAHNYYSVLRQQALGGGGLNATLPATLDGNIDPVLEGSSPVLGYFSVVSASEGRAYFNRDTVNGTPLSFDGNFNFDIPPPPGAPYVHPCQGNDRSSQAPQGWPE